MAWACTVHKVKRLTLNEVVVSFDLYGQKYFNFGQIYVALSRATSLQREITGEIEKQHVRANPKVHLEYERLRKISSLSETSPLEHSHNKLTVCLLNIRSLHKHSIDIKFDAKLMKSDVLAFTETQLLPHNSDAEIQQNLQPFILHRQDHTTDKYLSLAVCTKRHIFLLSKDYISTINAVKFVIFNSLTCNSTSFLLLY